MFGYTITAIDVLSGLIGIGTFFYVWYTKKQFLAEKAFWMEEMKVFIRTTIKGGKQISMRIRLPEAGANVRFVRKEINGLYLISWLREAFHSKLKDVDLGFFLVENIGNLAKVSTCKEKIYLDCKTVETYIKLFCCFNADIENVEERIICTSSDQI